MSEEIVIREAFYLGVVAIWAGPRSMVPEPFVQPGTVTVEIPVEQWVLLGEEQRREVRERVRGLLAGGSGWRDVP